MKVLLNYKNMRNIPPEILHQILRYLPNKDFCNSRLACRKLYQASLMGKKRKIDESYLAIISNEEIFKRYLKKIMQKDHMPTVKYLKIFLESMPDDTIVYSKRGTTNMSEYKLCDGLVDKNGLCIANVGRIDWTIYAEIINNPEENVKYIEKKMLCIPNWS